MVDSLLVQLSVTCVRHNLRANVLILYLYLNGLTRLYLTFIHIDVIIIKVKEATNLRRTKEREHGKGWREEWEVESDVNVAHICEILK